MRSHEEAPGAGGTGGSDQGDTGSRSSLPPAGDESPGATITCRYANLPGRSGACGAFTGEHHARAAALGLCCVDAAFYDVTDQRAGGAR